MKKLRQITALMRLNWRAMAGFELIYKLAVGVLFIPLFSGAFELIMRLRGYAYLTVENVFSFLLNPLTFLLLLVLIAAMTFASMLDIIAVIFMLDQSQQGVRVRLRQVAGFTWKNALRVLKKQNILLSLILLLLIPFLHAGVASSLISSISIPEFVEKFIFNNRLLTGLFVLLTLVVNYLLMRWMFAFHYFTLEGLPFSLARKKSAQLSRGRRFKTLFVLVIVQTLNALLHAALIYVGTLLILLMGKLFSEIFLVHVVTSALVWFVIGLSSIIISALSTPLAYGAVSALYYRWKQADGEALIHTHAPKHARSPRLRAVNIISCLVLIAGAGYFIYGTYTGRFNPQIEYVRTTEVTAHRGASALCPENTMIAFRTAQELGADWIELDVQQSADGEIFVMHDSNFRRTTGVSAYAWELTYADIRSLDAGSFFGEEFAGEPIPLLSEVIDFAKETGVRLNIELKPNGHETDFEQSVVDLILDADFADSCVVTSQVYSVLENIKTYCEDITTVYVMSFAYGNVNRLRAADHFSIESTSVTRKLVSRVHNAGKQLYAWTVNSQRRIDNMIDLNVDNIITDNVELAQERIYNSKFSTLVDDFIKALKQPGR